MFSRHDDRQEKSNQIPKEILSFIDKLIAETFEIRLKSKNLELSIFGELYENEIVLIFSLLNSQDPNLNTISLFVSDDISTDSKLEKKVDHLINSSSEFFETILNSSEEQLLELYSPRWQITDLKSDNFYYKISRENIQLTIEANKLLSEE
jgi:hypothetical protein